MTDFKLAKITPKAHERVSDLAHEKKGNIKGILSHMILSLIPSSKRARAKFDVQSLAKK